MLLLRAIRPFSCRFCIYLSFCQSSSSMRNLDRAWTSFKAFLMFLLITSSPPCSARRISGGAEAVKPCVSILHSGGGSEGPAANGVPAAVMSPKPEIAERFRPLLFNLLPKGQKIRPSSPSSYLVTIANLFTEFSDSSSAPGNGEHINIYDGRQSLNSPFESCNMEFDALSIQMEGRREQSKGEIHYVRDSDDEQPDSDEDRTVFLQNNRLYLVNLQSI